MSILSDLLESLQNAGGLDYGPDNSGQYDSNGNSLDSVLGPPIASAGEKYSNPDSNIRGIEASMHPGGGNPIADLLALLPQGNSNSDPFSRAMAESDPTESTSSPVEPGVSDSEKMKNLATHAANLQKIADHNANIINQRLANLKGESNPDTLSFVAKGNKIIGDMPFVPHGSYSKTQSQDEGSRATDKMVRNGFNPELASAIESIANARNPQQEKASEAALQLLPQRLSPQQQDLAFIDKLAQSKNPAALGILKVYFRRKGYSEEMINQLIGKNS